jgi:cytochrome c-type biogenesis protein CcmH
MTILKQALLALLLLGVVSQAFGKEATPMAVDPEMEKVVNEISAELRCLVCQNQTIADSHAPLAVDLKNQVRDMVKAGQSQDEIVDYMVQRYGDFVRYRPPMKASTMLLWVGPFILLLIGLVVLVLNLRKRASLVSDDGDLSAEENARLKSLLDSSQQKAKEDKS